MVPLWCRTARVVSRPCHSAGPSLVSAVQRRLELRAGAPGEPPVALPASKEPYLRMIWPSAADAFLDRLPSTFAYTESGTPNRATARVVKSTFLSQS